MSLMADLDFATSPMVSSSRSTLQDAVVRERLVNEGFLSLSLGPLIIISLCNLGLCRSASSSAWTPVGRR